MRWEKNCPMEKDDDLFKKGFVMDFVDGKAG